MDEKSKEDERRFERIVERVVKTKKIGGVF
jgi:hypothetical protein